MPLGSASTRILVGQLVKNKAYKVNENLGFDKAAVEVLVEALSEHISALPVHVLDTDQLARLGNGADQDPAAIA